MSLSPATQFLLKDALEEAPIESSAPCRVDCGGTWDLPAFSLPFHHVNPTTVNFAIALRTRVRLLPFKTGWTKVSSRDFLVEEYPSAEVPFDSPLGLVFAIATFFNVTGVHIHIESESPPRSALGGSGALGVAVVNAFSKALLKAGAKPISRQQLVEIAYSIENGVSVSLTGKQDQAAAAFGGVNQWFWKGDGGFERRELIQPERVGEVEPHLLVAYCGQTHDSADVNSTWVSSFLAGRNRSLWFEMNTVTNEFGRAVENTDWATAGALLRAETELRQALTPEVLIPATQALFNCATEHGCGARFTGAGGGGCLWAMGGENEIFALRQAWTTMLARVEGAKILPSRIDVEGAV